MTSSPGSGPVATQGARPTGVPSLAREYALSMATSGSLESYYDYGRTLASIWSSNLKGVKVTAEPAGASVGGLRSLGAGQVDMALAQSDIADYAYNGTQMFSGRISNIRAVAVLYPQPLQWVMNPNLVADIADMKGEEIAVGPAASGSEANSRQILDANDIAYKDLAKALFLSGREAVDAFKIREIVGFCLTDGIPSPAVSEAAGASRFSMLPITGAEAQRVTARYKRFTPSTIPAGSYAGLTTAAPTLEVQALLMVRQDLDNDLVYWLARTLVERQSDLAQASPLGRGFSRDTAAVGLPVPLHPGAEQYFKETGVLK